MSAVASALQSAGKPPDPDLKAIMRISIVCRDVEATGKPCIRNLRFPVKISRKDAKA